SDEFNKSSVEDLVPNPSEFEDECECDVPDYDDSQTTNFSTFSNPIFDDSTSSDDESSHEEVIHKMSFKTYLSPLFDLDEEIISRNVKDKILVSKLPKNCARCAKCGHPINGPYCQGCTLLREKLEEDLVTYFQNFQNTFESSDDSTNVVNAPQDPFVVKQDNDVNPSYIDECCCECGDALDGIFCQQCTCKSRGKDAHIGYNCPPKFLIISNPEPCNQTMNNELPQTLPGFDPTCYSDKENSVPCISKPNFVDESFNIFNPPPQPPIYSCEFCESNAQYGHYCTPQKQEEKRIKEEQAANARYWKILACCDDDDDYNSAITPVLSTKEPVDSLSMGDKHLDTIPATKSDEVIKSSVENLVPIPSEFEGIPDTIDEDSLYKENIEYVEASPCNSKVVSLEVAEIVIPKDKEIKDDNLRKKLLNVQITSGSTNTYSDISLSNYEVFYDDHIEDISSGSTTTHSDVSLFEYDSFIFDLLNDQFPLTDRSDFTHEEFVDELAHIISPLEYDCFYFRNLPDPGELISILNSGIRENLSSTTCVNLPVEDDHSLFWRMLYGSFLLISRIPLFLLIFTHLEMKIPSLTQALPLIIFVRLSRVYLIGVELSRNSILTVVT
nr:hypothetical protein [Tanacetum cinerariifolium]